MTRACRCGVLVLVVVVTVLMARPEALAQSADVIVTDRPDFTESAVVVAPRMVQFESGALFSTDQVLGTTAKDFAVPNLLVRLGVSDRLEFRVSTRGLVRESRGAARTGTRTSASDTAVGVKYQLTHQRGVGLDVAVLPFVSVPTGGAASSRNVDPGVKIAWGRTWGSAFLGGNVNWSAPTSDTGERDRLLEYSVSTGRGLWGAWGTYVEGVISTIDDSEAPTTFAVNTGLTRLFGNDLQADIRVGRGLNEAARDWTLGAGVSYRFRR